jgi:hypothetical protein
MSRSNAIRRCSSKGLLLPVAVLAFAFAVDAAADVYDSWLRRPHFASVAQALVEDGRPQEALRRLAAVDVGQLDASQQRWFYHVLCYASVEGRLAEQAVAACGSSIELGTAPWQDFANRGAARALLGEVDAAIADYRQAMRLGGDERRLRRAISGLRRRLAR